MHPRPFLTFAVAALLAAAAVLLPAAFAEDSLRLQRKLWDRQVLSAEETASGEYDMKGRVAGPAGRVDSRTGSHFEAEARAWRQTMRKTENGPVEVERTYEKATRTTEEVGSSKREEKPTSLQGRTVLISARGGRPTARAKEGKIAPEDLEAVLWSDGLYALLPDEPVKQGAVWQADAEALAKVFYGNHRERRPKAALTARGTLQGFTQVGDRRCADLRYQLDPGGGPSTVVNATLLFSIDDGTVLGFDMAGPISAEAGGPMVSAEGHGTCRLTYRAKITVKGEPLGEATEAEGRTPGPRRVRDRENR